MKANLRNLLKTNVAALARYSGVVRLRQRRSALVVLMLHKVNDEFDPLPLTVSTANFAAMLREIESSGLEVVSLPDYMPGMKEPVDGRLKIAVTFDDGYRDNYANALSLLRLHDLPATIYLSVDHVNGKRVFWYEKLIAAINRTTVPSLNIKPYMREPLPLNTPEDRKRAILFLNDELKLVNDQERMDAIDAISEQLLPESAESDSPMLTWDMIREMTTEKITMGSHTMSHPILSRETVERVRSELTESKRVIEMQTGTPIHTFAYPNGAAGDFSDDVVREVRDAGYTSACTTIPGFNDRSTDPYQLHRVNLHNAMCQSDNGDFDKNLFWSKVLQIF